MELNLKYQSVTSKPVGRLGKGWHHSYEWTLDDQTNSVIIYTDSGSKMIFEKDTNENYEPPEGSNWAFVSTASGYEAQLPNGEVYTFGTNGFLSIHHDAWGNWIECLYGTNDCLETVTHSNGRQVNLSNSWDSALNEWRVSTAQIFGGASLAFTYNGDGQFTQVVEQVGAASYTSSYQYADGYLTNKVNGAGFEYAFEYETGNDGLLNGKGTHLEVDGYYPHDVIYTNDSTTDVIYYTRGKEQTFRYSRNNYGVLTTKYGPAESIGAALQLGVRYTYSTNLVDKTEETLFDTTAGTSWSKWMQYDDAHNITNYAVAYNSTNQTHQFSLEYDPIWQLPSAVINAEGFRTEIVYTNGSPLVIKFFHSDTNSYDMGLSYTTNGLLQAVTNANEHIVDFSYNTAGDMISAMAELGPSITNTYDTLGFVQRMEILSENGASTGRITQYGRDAKGRVTQLVFADGLTNAYAYNALGYMTNLVDRAGNNTDYTYAPTRKLTSITKYLEQNGSNIPVRIGLDLDEQVNLLKITEPRGRYVESYQLDIQDRITSVTNIEDQVMSIDYSIGDFETEIVRFDGSAISNAYDAAGRRTSETYNVGTTNPLTMAYSYYADNQLESASDGTSTITNTYDRLNRLTGRSVQVSNFKYHVYYSLDPVGNLTHTTTSYKRDGGQNIWINTSCAYDEAERLKIKGSHAFAYNPDNGRMASISNTVDGITTSYAYDLMDRVTNIAHRTASGTLIRSLDYAYDDASMITNKIIAGGATSVSSSYKYDTLNRLTGETSFTNGTSASDIQYSYDLAGNRLSKTKDNLGSAYTLGTGNRLASSKTIYTIDFKGTSSEPVGTDDRWGELWVSNTTAQTRFIPQISGSSFWIDDLPLEPGTNQLIAAIRDQAGNRGFTTNTVYLTTPAINADYEYDDAGCVTNLNGTSLEWDERYRLTSAVRDSVFDIQYSYDVLGRKASRTENGITERYLHEGNHVVADLYDNLWYHRVYAYGSGIDNILTMTTYGNGSSSGTLYHYLKDHQNSVIALTDSSGTVVETYEYDAYGNTRVFDAAGTELTESAYGNRYTFQGREIDWSTGLIHFRARWYDPSTGRWLSKDPVGIRGGLNQYVAFGNNPVNFIDPMGEWVWWAITIFLGTLWLYHEIAPYFDPNYPPRPPEPEPPKPPEPEPPKPPEPGPPEPEPPKPE